MSTGVSTTPQLYEVFVQELVSKMLGQDLLTSWPDARRYEMLLARHRGADISPEEIGRAILVAYEVARELRDSRAQIDLNTDVQETNSVATGHIAEALADQLDARPMSLEVQLPAPAAREEFAVGPSLVAVDLEATFEIAKVTGTARGANEMVTALEVPRVIDRAPDPLLRRSGVMGGLSRQIDELPHNRLATISTWVRNIGVLVLLFVAWQLWGTSISEHHDQKTLQAEFITELHHSPKVETQTLIPATEVVANAPDGAVIGELQIPSIGLTQYVVSGTSSADLSKGPGHYMGTAVPGQAGNVAIAGHRTTHGAPFNRLAQLAVGDPVFLATTSGQRLKYVVAQRPFAVAPTDVAVLNYFGDNRLTLTTCTPEFSSAQRLIVVAKLSNSPIGASTVKSRHIVYVIKNATTASWNWKLLLPLGLEIIVLFGLGLMNRGLVAHLGTFGGWLILTPIWIGAVYLLFQTLTGFLPASV
jgi:LPXTG-site transpeptidase (sortase) family protein